MLTALNDSIMSYCLLSTVLLVNVLILFQGFITYVHSCDHHLPKIQERENQSETEKVKKFYFGNTMN